MRKAPCEIHRPKRFTRGPNTHKGAGFSIADSSLPVKKGFPMKLRKYLPAIRDGLIFFTCLILACGADGIVDILIP